MKTTLLFSIEIIDDCWFDHTAQGDLDFSITADMSKYIDKHGFEKAKELILKEVNTVLERSKPR